MRWFRRKPTPQKYIEATITVGTNLYLHTISNPESGLASLRFSRPDSRYRYLVFCLSTAVTAALAYDEKKEIEPEILIKGCMHFAKWIATEHPREYFDDSCDPLGIVASAPTYFEEYLKGWSRWPQFEKDGRSGETIDLITLMIHSAESHVSADKNDLVRLSKLAVEIACRLPTMRGALVELANR